MKYAIIMAAGKGTRMKSDLPKVMHEVCGKTMIERSVETLKETGADRIIAIVGYGHEVVEKAMAGKCEFALQQPQLGTGHAVMQAKQLEGLEGLTIVANGDCPCIKKETFNMLYDALNDAEMVVLTVKLDDARSYGRVVKDEAGNIERIVEFKDCTDAQKEIKEINTGIYAFNNKVLFENLKDLKNNNNQKEYYITDLVEILKNKHYRVKAVLAEDPREVAGINDQKELAEANEYMKLN